MLKRKVKRITINPLFLVALAAAIWLGITGRVDWWVIVLIALSHMEMKMVFTIE